MRRYLIRLQLLAAVLALVIAVPVCAAAQPVPLATSGAWTTFGDTVSEQKTCGVQGDIAGGKFLLFGRSDRPDTLRLTLYKQSWKILDVTVPINLSFGGGAAFNFLGRGHQAFIRADVPMDQVKALIHHFTADDTATLTLPDGHEPPWQLSLQGTTPTIESMALCLDTAKIWLPPPFRQAPAALPATPSPPFAEEQSLSPTAMPAAAPVVPKPAALAPASPQSVMPPPENSNTPAVAQPQQPLLDAHTTTAKTSCKEDWKQCTDNADIANNYSDWAIVRAACEIQASQQARYGTPIWPGFWSGGSFTHFHGGSDYVTTGVAVAVEPDAQFQNGFGAMAHSTVLCTYDLKTKTVTNIQIDQN